MKYDPADNILSGRAKRLKKTAEERPYFENTNDVLGMYKNPTLKTKEKEDEDDEDKKTGGVKGKALLKRIYGGGDPCWKGYEQFGMKTKKGKKVPNCIPVANKRLKAKGGKMAVPKEERIEPENEETNELPEIEEVPEFFDIVENTDIEEFLDEITEWFKTDVPAGLATDYVSENEYQALYNNIALLERFTQLRNLNTAELREFSNRINFLGRLYETIKDRLNSNNLGILSRSIYNPNRTWSEFFGRGRGSKKEVNTYNRVVDNYSDVVNHLEEHLKEKAGDPLDAKQSKYLKGEIKRINELHLTPAMKVGTGDNLYKVSNPREVQKKAFELYGKDAIVYKSDKPKKKYQILNKLTGKWVHFGDAKMEDFTKHQDLKRQSNYLNRSLNIKGKWKQNPYSPNTLSIMLLW